MAKLRLRNGSNSGEVTQQRNRRAGNLSSFQDFFGHIAWLAGSVPRPGTEPGPWQ